MIYKQRRAFSLITAIFIIVIMATVTALVMGTAGKIVHETTAQYQKEQAVLLAKSYTEYAIMTVMSNDRIAPSNCIRDIDADIDDSPDDGKGYRVRTRIAFIGSAAEVASCAATRTFSNAVLTAESPLNIIVDVYVEYKDINHPELATTPANVPWIIYHRRTLQKI